jgi:allantoate deiminase
MAPEKPIVTLKPVPDAGEAGETAPSSLEAIAQRISEMLSAIGAVGADPAGGVSRLAYTEPERNAHRLAAAWLTELGLRVREDAAGNTIADDPTADDATARIVLGSHLDSVPRGGSFDGVAGVVAAVEVVRGFQTDDRRLSRPLRVVCFAGEEGARFGEPCIGSKAIAGLLPASALSELTDEHGVTLGQAMMSIGLDPARLSEARWASRDVAAFLELHVEQGRTLENQGVPLGLVDAIAGSARMLLTVQGRADHSGGALMRDRGDALAAAAEIVLAVESAGRELANHSLRATVGRMAVEPNSQTTIPGLVRLAVDVRDVDTERLRSVATSLIDVAGEICDRRGVVLEARVIADTSPVILPTWVRKVATDTCQEMRLEYRVVTSGAGRDAQVMNHLAPAGLVLVPSRRGLSHVPDEWTSSVDIARGVLLLVEWVARLDQQLSQWEHAGG